ncbi:(2Fe-2S)-binding protein [Hoeflea prorocentri]|uniref:(2Fe-2S)-binding protein n=1 Tax=Hoeflea prorocentri TaxID=1922333 RepID=A0A9X3UMW6_9HYPH|nr:(2Fe-2S)-binding protein [Hoeflea prorocentri]MCY6381996.1 (2Fe-2S)-binding protein [Hoeflea prorocentri]MDA5399796.1 (2Fe-2S)-binding protein [Hoeflea prorocentri]
MIACHCNIITESEIEQVIVEMLNEERWQLIVPAKVYHAMEKRGKCCRCFPNVVDIIIRTSEAFHLRFDSSAVDMVSYRAKLIELRNHYAGDLHERQQKGNRAA